MSIRAVRKRAGMSQSELARRSSVAREQINRYENGRNYPDVKSLILIKNALGCTLEELVEEDEGDAGHALFRG